MNKSYKENVGYSFPRPLDMLAEFGVEATSDSSLDTDTYLFEAADQSSKLVVRGAGLYGTFQ